MTNGIEDDNAGGNGYAGTSSEVSCDSGSDNSFSEPETDRAITGSCIYLSFKYWFNKLFTPC